MSFYVESVDFPKNWDELTDDEQDELGAEMIEQRFFRDTYTHIDGAKDEYCLPLDGMEYYSHGYAYTEEDGIKKYMRHIEVYYNTSDLQDYRKPDDCLSYVRPRYDNYVKVYINEEESDEKQILGGVLGWMRTGNDGETSNPCVYVFYNNGRAIHKTTYEKAQKIKEILDKILGENKFEIWAGWNKDEYLSLDEYGKRLSELSVN